MKIDGLKTYIVAIAAAAYQAAYASGHLNFAPDVHELILGLFAAAGAITVRHAIAKAAKPDGADNTKPTP